MRGEMSKAGHLSTHSFKTNHNKDSMFVCLAWRREKRKINKCTDGDKVYWRERKILTLLIIALDVYLCVEEDCLRSCINHIMYCNVLDYVCKTY